MSVMTRVASHKSCSLARILPIFDRQRHLSSYDVRRNIYLPFGYPTFICHCHVNRTVVRTIGQLCRPRPRSFPGFLQRWLNFRYNAAKATQFCTALSRASCQSHRHCLCLGLPLLPSSRRYVRQSCKKRHANQKSPSAGKKSVAASTIGSRERE